MRRDALSMLASAILHLASAGLAWAFFALELIPPRIELDQGSPITVVMTMPAPESAPPVEVNLLTEPAVEPTPTEQEPPPKPELESQPVSMARATQEPAVQPPPQAVEQLAQTEFEPQAERVPVEQFPEADAPPPPSTTRAPSVQPPLAVSVPVSAPDPAVEPTEALAAQQISAVRNAVENQAKPPAQQIESMVQPPAEPLAKRTPTVPREDSPPTPEQPPDKPKRTPRDEPVPVVTTAAIPFQATARTGVEVDEPPVKLSTNRPPSYPLDALQAGIEGRVVLRVVVGSDGKVLSTALETSGGFASLDRAATDAVQNWRFSPARRAGLAVEYEVLVPVNFRIRRG